MSNAICFQDENGDWVWTAEGSPVHKAHLRRQELEEKPEAGEVEHASETDDLPQQATDAGAPAELQPTPRNRRRNR
ncbi:hypothetical protein QVA66_03935 [Staphylococcus chromogenes]|nr:hypothetical protein [Staphylococcus chromogenes]